MEGQQIAQILEQILLRKYGLITTLGNILIQESSHTSQRHAEQISCRTLVRQVLKVCVVLCSAVQINLCGKGKSLKYVILTQDNKVTPEFYSKLTNRTSLNVINVYGFF